MPPRFQDEAGLAHLQSFASKHGGTVLTTTYGSLDSHYLCRCSEGHEWLARGSSITQGRWCRKCHFQGRRVGMPEFRAQVEQRGGEVLEPEYHGNLAEHLVRCADGHEWRTTPNRLQRGSWCPFCNRERRQGKCQP